MFDIGNALDFDGPFQQTRWEDRVWMWLKELKFVVRENLTFYIQKLTRWNDIGLAVVAGGSNLREDPVV